MDDGSELTPDGQWLYFNSNRSGHMQIWRMKPDGSRQEQITFDRFNNWFPHIAPDGKSMVIISYGEDIQSGDHPFYKHVYLRHMALDGTNARVIAYVFGGQGTHQRALVVARRPAHRLRQQHGAAGAALTAQGGRFGARICLGAHALPANVVSSTHHLSCSGKIRAMSVVVRTSREGDRARLIPTGAFTLADVTAVARAVADVEATLHGCRLAELDVTDVEAMDGAGAVLFARLLDRLDEAGCRTELVGGHGSQAARQILLYRERRTGRPPAAARTQSTFGRIGTSAAEIPATATAALDFVGRVVAAVPMAILAPRSVDWRSVPRLVETIGADGLPVASAANLLVGLIIGFIGVSQLGRFGATVYVPELVVVAHFRELGPLVTAIVVAGRSGAGLASEIATMKVSEEIDALRSMGFDPVRWLVVPRCLALVISVPILAWLGDILALVGAMAATMVLTDMSPRAFVLGTMDAITASHFLAGLVKTPFLALAIGLIACGQGLATMGGAAAVGARTTTAVVLAIFSVIVISALFTSVFALVGV